MVFWFKKRKDFHWYIYCQRKQNAIKYVKHEYYKILYLFFEKLQKKEEV